ncbi:MAG: hypothetical protein PHN98_11540, partial [Smithellaceae bacterium]|nr:hypothetical protein [Smithellaceae bacterium]
MSAGKDFSGEDKTAGKKNRSRAIGSGFFLDCVMIYFFFATFLTGFLAATFRTATFFTTGFFVTV